jgi:predicted amidohydrolase
LRLIAEFGISDHIRPREGFCKMQLRLFTLSISLLCLLQSVVSAADTAPSTNRLVRIAAIQPKARLIDWHLAAPDQVLARIDHSLAELEQLIDRAVAEHCRAIALPEDTLGLGTWLAGNEKLADQVLGPAVERMLTRFQALAAKHHIYIISCNDHALPDRTICNTSFLIGPDGREIGRYQKVCPVIHENAARGSTFPVFQTRDLGGVGLLICYDMVFPETARALALGGADIIFHSTLGGAAIGDDDISRAAFRTRAVENFVYIVVSQRGSGSMIVSPQGKILAEAHGPDTFAVADIDPFAGREGSDAMNAQADMRARLFRERNPSAFAILTDPNPPALRKLPETITATEARDIANKVLTVGQEEFNAADRLLHSQQNDQARAAFLKLKHDYRDSWIDRVATERLASLDVANTAEATKAGDSPPQPAKGLAAKYPGDRGIESDPAVLFADNFESGTINRWDEKRGPITLTHDHPHSGNWCVQMPMQRGKNHGSDAIKWFLPGSDKVYARVYVKFSADYQYSHHFLWLGANQRTNKWSAFGKAGLKPNGTYYSTGMEPWFAWGKNPPPGELNLYTYYLDMEPDKKMNKYWGNSFFPPGPAKGSAAGPARVVPALNEWHCWEFMIQANSTPDNADGSQAMWYDGKLIGEFTGIRWRNDLDLKVNCFWLQHYGYDESDPTRQFWKESQSVWFDDLVVARKYIGPQVNQTD